MSEIETEEECARGDVAAFVRDLANQLEAGGEVVLELGGETLRCDPSGPITFKMEAEEDRSAGEPRSKNSLEFELVWWEDAGPA